MRTKSDLKPWPDDLELTPLLRMYAEERKLDAEQEWENFHDYHLAHGSKFADWAAAFRTWCRNAVKYAAERAGHRLWEVGTGGQVRPIGFTAPKAQPTVIEQHEQCAREDMAITPEQRVANLKMLREAGEKIGKKI